jgi:hypothetical protein
MVTANHTSNPENNSPIDRIPEINTPIHAVLEPVSEQGDDQAEPAKQATVLRISKSDEVVGIVLEKTFAIAVMAVSFWSIATMF